MDIVATGVGRGHFRTAFLVHLCCCGLIRLAGVLLEREGVDICARGYDRPVAVSNRCDEPRLAYALIGNAAGLKFRGNAVCRLHFLHGQLGVLVEVLVQLFALGSSSVKV